MPSTGVYISRSLFPRSTSLSSSSVYLSSWTCLSCRNYGKERQRWHLRRKVREENCVQRRLFSVGSIVRTQVPAAHDSQSSNIKDHNGILTNDTHTPDVFSVEHQNPHNTETTLRKITYGDNGEGVVRPFRTPLRNASQSTDSSEQMLKYHGNLANDVAFSENRRLRRILRRHRSTIFTSQNAEESNRSKAPGSEMRKMSSAGPRVIPIRLHALRRAPFVLRVKRQHALEPSKTSIGQMLQSARLMVASTDMLSSIAGEQIANSEEIIRIYNQRFEAVDFPQAQAYSSETSSEMKNETSEHQERVFNEKDLFKTNTYDLTFRAKDIKERIIDVPMEKPPRLHHGLDRVLFNPGVYHLRNQRTGVFNFDPYLEKIEPVSSFDIEAMSSFTTPSEDKTLAQTAMEHDCKYSASTSSSTNLLKHLHFILSNARQLNDSAFSKGFDTQEARFFTNAQKRPSSVFLRYKKGENGQEGHYSIDSDSHLDSPRELSLTGVLLEKLLTSPKDELQRYKLENAGGAGVRDGIEKREGSYHYTAYGRILVRSQLDAYDPRLPGSGIFDLKTRACAAVRLDWEERSLTRTSNYQLRDNLGLWESYEREQFDLMRTAMLKYSLQVRLGRMDGIFLAYHNTAKMFGFQYMPLEDLDFLIHGQKDRSLGDQELAMSMQLLEEILERATKRFPEQTLWIHFDTRFFKSGPFLRIFVEPVSDELCDRLKKQTKERRKSRAVVESSISKMAAETPALTPEELDATKESAENLAESVTGLTGIMEENRLANLAELAEFGYQEEQILNMLKSYFEIIRTMEGFVASDLAIEEEEALKRETEIVTAINAAISECQPLVDIFPEQRQKVESILKSEILGKSESSTTSKIEAEEPEAPEEAYLKIHNPSELAAYELRVVNHVAGYGFVQRPTRVFGQGLHRRLSVRASLKEVEDAKAAKRTYDIMRKAVLNRGADRFYEGWFFSNLLRLSEAGRRWAEDQERRHKGREVVQFEPFDGT